MRQAAVSYAKALKILGVPGKDIQASEEILKKEPLLKKALENPFVTIKEKERAVSRIFPGTMKNFLCVVCARRDVSLLEEIWEAYEELERKEKGILKATLFYVTPPSPEQKEKIEGFLKDYFQKDKVELSMRKEPALLGGFVLEAGGHRFDNSLKGRFDGLKEKLTER